MTPTDPVTYALVLETNNLKGGGPQPAVVSALARLLRRLRAQTRPLDSLDQLVITHDGLDAASQTELRETAGRPISFVGIPRGAGYYEAKNRGFAATRADVVAFGDADCWPDAGWLEALLEPFARQTGAPVQIVAGRTTYRDDMLGAAATAIDFMYFPTPVGQGCTRNFYANNVAFRRATFERFHYLPDGDVYRGHCQKLAFRLHEARVPIGFAPRARTIHRMPDSPRELLRLRLLRGADTVAMAPAIARSSLPASLAGLGRVPGLAPLGILAVRFGLSVRAVNRQDLTAVTGWRRAACLAEVLGLSLLDATGAVARALGLSDLGVRDGSLERKALGYVGNADALEEGGA